MDLFTLHIHWESHGDLVIRDIRHKWYDRIRNYMLENHFLQNPLYNTLQIQESAEEKDNYLNYVTHILRDDCSIVVMDEETQQIYAVALIKWLTEKWHSWTVLKLVVGNEKFAEIIHMRRNMVLDYADAHPERVFDGLHIFEYHIDEELRQDPEFMTKFFFAISETARHMKMPRVTFTALSFREQGDAITAGLEELSRIMYGLYENKKKAFPFATLRGIDEMSCILYDCLLEPLVPYNDMIVREAPNFDKQIQLMTQKTKPGRWTSR